MLGEKKGVRERATMQPQVQVKRRRRRRRDGEEEEPVLRTTCDNCTSAKVKCNGERPCLRCKTKGIHCEYTYKKRCGPKRRKGLDANRDGEGLLASCKLPAERIDDHLRGMAVMFNPEEVECVRVFMQNLNTFLPMTTFETMELAATSTANATNGSSVTDSQDDEEANQLHHARRALLHGAIAVGAEILEKGEVSIAHAGIARQEIKECFDAAAPELVGAYMVLALYWIHQNDSTKIARYVGLAHQSHGIIHNPPSELVASLTLISVMLYDTKVIPTIGYRVIKPEPAGKPNDASLKTSVARQERVLRILSFVLLSIHNRSLPRVDPMMSTGPWDPNTLSKDVDEAKDLLDTFAMNGMNDMSKCIVMVLQAYFVLLLKSDRKRAVLITEPLADLVADNPTILHLPILWSMLGCVRVLLRSSDRTIAIERLQSAMDPLTARLGFSTDESLIEQELMRVFQQKHVEQRSTGSIGIGSLPVPSQSSIFFRSKAQTSSLNVTAGDYSVLSGRAGDLLNLEPSQAPSRRGLSGSVGEQIVSGDNVQPLSSFMLSGPMVSSPSSLLVSSAPASRAGALTRAPPGGRNSLSINAQIERSKATLRQQQQQQRQQQLDMSSHVPDREFSESVPPGVVPIPPADLLLTGSPVSGVTVEVKPDLATSCDDVSGVGDELLDELKLDTDRNELMTRQKIQPSFKADAPVSLEQVESNMARLGVNTAETDPEAKEFVTQMDVEAAAELIATRTSLIA